MKILYAITKSNWGGAQRYLYDLASGLPKNRFEVRAVVGGEGILTEKLQAAGIKTRTLPILQETSSLFHSLFSFVNFKAAWDLRKIIKEEQPDVLHLNSSKIIGLGALAALGLKTKVVFTVHGWPFLEERFFIPKFFIWLLSWISSWFCNKIILITRKDFALAKKFIPSSKLVYIPNGIAPMDFRPIEEARLFFSRKIGKEIPPGAITIGAVAELTKNKGLTYLIDAARLLPGSSPLIFIIGEGEEKKKLESKIRNYELGSKVFILGFIPEAARWLKGFNIFVLPSLKEGLPYTVLEAQAAGLPIIAAAVGGIPDLLAGQKGEFMVEPKNPAVLADVLRHLIQKIGEREELKNFEPRSVNSLQNMLTQTIKVYQ